jgi:hypothetical protein
MSSFLDYGVVKDTAETWILSLLFKHYHLCYNFSPSPLQKHYNACQAHLQKRNTSLPPHLTPKWRTLPHNANSARVREPALCHATGHGTKSSDDSVTKCRHKFRGRSVTATFIACDSLWKNITDWRYTQGKYLPFIRTTALSHMGFVRNIHKYEPRMFFIQHQSRNFKYYTWCINITSPWTWRTFKHTLFYLWIGTDAVFLYFGGEGIRETKLFCIYLMLYLPVFDNLTTFTQQHKPNIFAATRPKDDLYPILHTHALISNISHLLNC